ncbi:PREDICTED: uncharacterized protein LOC106117098 [Papilio xuthus]|uniref:Uncharacterized protein LOC106117098 n=1 Tax=Papilio xuthus TaxID=66420 RepID=A0AAJ7E830_PAPXU|nr:PREDICTED: uncharacterized protein LOC106117098 [Papilio xuthus]
MRSSYPKWDNYESKVSQLSRWKPDPREADICIASLAKNRLNKRVCRFLPMCYNMLVNGTNFGYSLTHRLLWLIQAHRGRGCRIFSTREDKELIDMFCTKIFREANYIAANNFKILDLLLEQMTLCSLSGYPDTLRRTWIAKALKHQTSLGCFTLKLPAQTSSKYSYKGSDKWAISAPTVNMVGGACDRHLTAVASGAISGAVRYILEQKYSNK